jgi:hypothetical protein
MMNQLIKDFRVQVRSRFAEDSDTMSYSQWIEKNTKYKKRPFSFRGFEFQRAIVDDMSPNMSVIKCSQIGLTEVQMRKFAAFLARNIAVSGIFTLPNDDMYRRVSTTRFGPVVNTESVFNLGFEKPIRRMDLYQVNQSFGYFVGNKESDATSINADLLFHDEVDLSNQEMLGLFQSRLQGSDYRITQGFSTPTFEGFGIDATFRISDQHEYMAKCVHCNDWSIPEFNPQHVIIPGFPDDLNSLTEIDADIASRLDTENAYVRCQHCGEPLNLHDPSLREWVPRHAGRKSRGYRVTPFCTPRITIPYMIEQLIQYKQKDAMRRFYNTVLGMPYNDSNARLSELEIRAVMHGSAKPAITGKVPVWVGIDMGITCHMVIGTLGAKPSVIEWRQVVATNLVDEIRTLMDQYDLVGGTIDRNPYTPLAEEIRDLTDQRIIPVEYANSVMAPAVNIKKTELDELSHIQANRTIMLDAVVGAIRKRQIEFYGYGSHEALLVQHLRDMVRIEEPDTSAMWQKLTGNDHFFHALGYLLFAFRASDALLYRSDADKRVAFSSYSLIAEVQNEPEISMKRRRTEPMLLGAI